MLKWTKNDLEFLGEAVMAGVGEGLIDDNKAFLFSAQIQEILDSIKEDEVVRVMTEQDIDSIVEIKFSNV